MRSSKVGKEMFCSAPNLKNRSHFIDQKEAIFRLIHGVVSIPSRTGFENGQYLYS